MCSDRTLYTGISNNVERRVSQHSSGRGAKYTRSRSPVCLMRSWEAGTKGDALRIEYRFKQLSRHQKEEAISRCNDKEDLLTFLHNR
jgi:putative endonuclease